MRLIESPRGSRADGDKEGIPTEAELVSRNMPLLIALACRVPVIGRLVRQDLKEFLGSQVDSSGRRYDPFGRLLSPED